MVPVNKTYAHYNGTGKHTYYITEVLVKINVYIIKVPVNIHLPNQYERNIHVRKS